ncbi:MULTISPECIES: helix-turn-helix transcriptional regulator [Glutamicibacter]|uniref:helix-turn-helix transcriptional regulator n=1 Tax=Glutamicibacter TaxID=1742989 RepID=UPI0002E82232|nr:MULTISPECIES: helix-turn-helix domain-containing protein [Glutamicibacter]NQD42443.1 helix-turn-helix domain-containing protein [Glutamicibacter halophytocola]HCH48303.1 helix-turn-helix domain-containing protein [Glutamicibacter sp.]
MSTLFASLMTLAEVAKATGIPVNTLRYYRQIGGKGPKSALIGGRVMYREQDVIDWVNAQFDQDAS